MPRPNSDKRGRGGTATLGRDGGMTGEIMDHSLVFTEPDTAWEKCEMWNSTISATGHVANNPTIPIPSWSAS